MRIPALLRRPLQQLRTLLYPLSELGVEVQEVHDWYIERLSRNVRLDIYLPPAYYEQPRQRYPVVIFNDGQDLPGMKMRDILHKQYEQNRLQPTVVVGVYAGDRLREYGTPRHLDYQGRGDRSAAYERFICQELLPFLRLRYRLSSYPQDTALAGFSLGGLSALAIAWRNPDIFQQVGVFSGALWWRSRAFNPQHPDADRIVHTELAKGPYQPGMRFWCQAGTADEKDDRNKNGVIDSIDDTLDLIQVLATLGYQRGKDLHYVEVQGGRHEPQTWATVMPDFLSWAFPI